MKCSTSFSNLRKNRGYTLLYWASDPREEKCSVLSNMEAVKKEVALDRAEVKIDVDAVFSSVALCLILDGQLFRHSRTKPSVQARC